MPARHTSLQDGLLFEADFNRWLWSTKEGVGETSGQRLDRIFEEFALGKPGPAEETGFSSFGADLGPQFHRAPKPQVKSGPDVFADPLVPMPALIMPGALIFQIPNPE
jgi:hypothetical protein